MPKIQSIVVCLSLALQTYLLGQSVEPRPTVQLVDNSARAPQQRSRVSSERQVFKARISPNWFADGTKFWYRNDLRDGKCEFVLVDALAGDRRLAFDHQRLAMALTEQAETRIEADNLPIDGLVFNEQEVLFRFLGKSWQCDLNNYEVAEIDSYEDSNAADQGPIHPDDLPRASTQTGAETEIRFVNQTSGTVQLFWLDTRGARSSYGRLAAGQSRIQHTYAGHYWIAVDESGTDLAAFRAEEGTVQAIIDGESISHRSPRNRTRRPQFRSRVERGISPDGKWLIVERDGNLFVSEPGMEDLDSIQLTQDGTADRTYSQFSWSPDAKSLVAFRITPGERKEVFLIESSPRGGGRAKLTQRPYTLPGDRFTSYELHLFQLRAITEKEDDAQLNKWQEVNLQVEPIDFGRPRIRWENDGSAFTYTKVDRGHQRFRMIRVSATSGEARNVIDEQTDTFIWTAHTADVGIRTVTPLDESHELIYVSEVDGRRHLYLIDPSVDRTNSDPDTLQPQVLNGNKRLVAPGLKNQITRGKFVVRGVDRIDEEKRELWFRASGGYPKQDPYFIHFYRVNFDGTGLVELTPENGNHSVQFSPDRRFLIDTYSRIDAAPQHELRSATDGRLICELDQADITALEDSGWQSPEVFVAKARDGQTDIWGIICRPRDYDPSKSYPVIEDIYAGPHGSFVPKSFSSRERYAALHQLGFIVVKIDGMGTANRTKEFHDVCWHNLKDAGFPDRIRWMKTAAKQYPEMDLSRVGIYGGSAGGQNAAAAVLFHNDFYKVAVAGCGCHDNRMDKASWNEQWMGYPVGPQYSKSSNIDNAWRLEGKLMLILGELDTNVPPESTLRFADALIKADKDFDLIVIPGAGHGMGGRYGTRRMNDFFAEHLLNP